MPKLKDWWHLHHMMQINFRVLALATLPLLVSALSIAIAVRHHEQELAKRQKALVESSIISLRETELRHYVELARSAIKPLYDSEDSTQGNRLRAIALLRSMDFGDDGYFFLYDLDGVNLMHPRQPELEGHDLWQLRIREQPVIQNLVERANAGGGVVRYSWRKPSTGQITPKIGYVVALPKWGWMFGTGLYLDDVQQTLDALDRRVNANSQATLAWIALISFGGLAAIATCGGVMQVSQSRTADAKLRVLARKVVQSQEDERAHLSRELHDGVSQALVSIKLLVESAGRELAPGRLRVAPVLERALERINLTLRTVRTISHRLRPAELDMLGLPAALQDLGDSLSDAQDTGFRLHVRGNAAGLSSEVATVLFRIAQEAITNIERHASASHVSIRLMVSEGHVRLRILDDGAGFDVSAVNEDPRRGIGLRNMRERASTVGGRLSISSRVGRTDLRVDIPRPAAT